MKKVISLLLVLTLCMACVCTAFATGDGFMGSPGEHPDDCDHPNTTIVGGKDPTCTEPGHTGDEVCTDCGEVVDPGETIPPKGHNYVDGYCTICGGSDNPKTGEDGMIFLWIALLIVSGAALVGVIVYRKKFAAQ